MKKKRGGGGKEPSLKEQIEASGETPKDPVLTALQTDQTDRRYLGREFLTWILYYASEEEGGGRFTCDTVDDFQVIPGGQVLLKAMGDGAGEILAKGAAPAQMADVRYAVAGGLSVREAELFFQRGERLWQVTVNAEQFDLKRVKLPDLVSDDDTDRALERLDLLDELDLMLLAAYGVFLRRRLAATWETQELPRIKIWLAHSILEPDTSLEDVLAEVEAEYGPPSRPAGGAGASAPRRGRRRASEVEGEGP